MRGWKILVCVLALPSAALAQEETTGVTVSAARGLMVDRPFTLFYPEPLQLVEDGDTVTVATLEYPNAPLQCDAMVADGGDPGWTAESAATNLDRSGTEAGWLEQFPGFTIGEVSTVAFQSGDALYYRGSSDDSPLGVPATIFHAEAVDDGRTYIYECLADSAIADQAQGLVDFLFANFSTRADGECCIDPAARQE